MAIEEAGRARVAVDGPLPRRQLYQCVVRHHQVAQPGERRFQLMAMHDHVDHAVGEQIFGALEAIRQLLADGLLDHARAGKADQRTGLGEMNVAQHRVRRSDAAGGRVGQHHEIGQPFLAQALHRDRRARHLHQRQDAFLHARAARRCEQDEWRLLLDRPHHAGDHGLSRRHAERAADEAHVVRCGNDQLAVELALADQHGIVELGLGAGFLEAIGILDAVAELERVHRHRRHRDLGVLAVVEQVRQALRRRHAIMEIRSRKHELVVLQILVENHLAGLGVRAPHVVRHLALGAEEPPNFRADDVVDPVHVALAPRCRYRTAALVSQRVAGREPFVDKRGYPLTAGQLCRL